VPKPSIQRGEDFNLYTFVNYQSVTKASPFKIIYSDMYCIGLTRRSHNCGLIHGNRTYSVFSYFVTAFHEHFERVEFDEWFEKSHASNVISLYFHCIFLCVHLIIIINWDHCFSY